jgi:selenocysteine lyase/cysteine desulfurase
MHEWVNAKSRNIELARWTGQYLEKLWNTKLLVDSPLQASIVTVQIPLAGPSNCEDSCSRSDLHDELYKLGIQLPIFTFKNKKYCRISINCYNSKNDVIALGKAVQEILNLK